jgi:hypothetical protein
MILAARAMRKADLLVRFAFLLLFIHFYFYFLKAEGLLLKNLLGGKISISKQSLFLLSDLTLKN